MKNIDIIEILMVITTIIVTVIVGILIIMNFNNKAVMNNDAKGVVNYEIKHDVITESNNMNTYTENIIEDKVDEIVKDNYILIIGDSRTVGMNAAMNMSENDHIKCIAKVSEGYYYLKAHIEDIREFYETYETETTKANIICNMGINDLSNIDNYIKFYKDLLKEGIPIVFLTVNPVDESKYGCNIKNTTIDEFNDKMKKIGIEVIDSNEYLMTDGFSTQDGIHYTNDTYNKIYMLICDYYNIVN